MAKGATIEYLSDEVIKMKFRKLWDLSGYSERTMSNAPVYQKLESTIHWINHYPVDKPEGNQYCTIQYPVDKKKGNQLHYPVDRDLSHAIHLFYNRSLRITIIMQLAQVVQNNLG